MTAFTVFFFFTAAVPSACINRKSPISGQERFGNMTRVYYKEAVGAFIVFDVTRAATFEAVVKWKLDLDTKVQLPDGSPIPCVLLANKVSSHPLKVAQLWL
jgi:signal recognition particle receptor subunit beta